MQVKSAEERADSLQLELQYLQAEKERLQVGSLLCAVGSSRHVCFRWCGSCGSGALHCQRLTSLWRAASPAPALPCVHASKRLPPPSGSIRLQGELALARAAEERAAASASREVGATEARVGELTAQLADARVREGVGEQSGEPQEQQGNRSI